MSIYIRIALIVGIIAISLGGYLYVQRLQEKVTEQEITIRQREEEVSRLTGQVKDLSAQKATFEAALVTAELERNRIRDDLSKALTRLRTQKPPTECKAAIEWAVDNKGDLQW